MCDRVRPSVLDAAAMTPAVVCFASSLLTCLLEQYVFWGIRAQNFSRDTPDLIRIKNTPVQVVSIFHELALRRIKARCIWTPVKTINAQQRCTNYFQFGKRP